ncbi:MAG: DUF3301 domain-containing protein [Gammaproteobacteria bacterium]|nr:DUF3301 domain-containing protein [Gammaproteobacteria bacterium]
MPEILLIVALFFVLKFWYQSMKSREQAVAAAKRACSQINVQLLDDTVEMIRLRLCRTNSGTVALCRLYSFDFSMDGEQRHTGTISMRGREIIDVVLDIDQVTAIQ